ADGSYQFQFRVVDKNASSTGYTLSFDYIKLSPIPAATLAPIEQWRQAKFGANAGNTAIAGDNADPDGDGMTNVFEYALGRDPLTADPAPVTSLEKNGGYLTLIFKRAKAATDMTFIVEVKSDLDGGWTTNVQTP